MRVVFCGQVPKDPSYPEATEDAVEIALDVGRVAISDGASESFDSKTWAKLLVETFASTPGLSPDWLSKVVGQYNEQYDLSTLSWSKQAAFERGSFATLLGVEMFPVHSTVDVLSVGDSLAVLLSGSEMVDSFPYKDAQQFHQRPELFCTNPSHNGFISDPDFFSCRHKTWELKQLAQPAVLCMTDAIGEWALKMAQEGSPQWATLLSITDNAQLQAIVRVERESRRMRVDDVTLVSILFDRVAPYELPNA
ncbi:hypothetical protein [Ralstonia solanacearum]|uniref:hypothetical protein n=1 Tax=Ralstonia solanacearum TaxID=305 RepID=UPI00168B4616|nr:hypothetical protein [Ralstonia solanacearum]QNT25240.1 hypothetical protein C2I38_24605 [Ralstonia solanacearum]QNT62884.1 hypothetical protein C2L97_24635 [Ralstonia solanacearum]